MYNVSSIILMGKVSDSKNIVTALVYICSYPCGTPCRSLSKIWVQFFPELYQIQTCTLQTTPGGIIAWEKYKIIFHAKILTICFMRIVITILKSNYKYVHRYIIVLTYIHIHCECSCVKPRAYIRGSQSPLHFSANYCKKLVNSS